MLPLGFFQFTLAAAMGAALTALEEVPEQALSPDLKGDLWLAWVRLVALALEQRNKAYSEQFE